jgi:hypothetical protein
VLVPFSKIPDLTAKISNYKQGDDQFNFVFFTTYEKTILEINRIIGELAKHDKDDIFRIENLWSRPWINDDKIRLSQEKPPTTQEVILSVARVACISSSYTLKEGDVIEAFNLLMQSVFYLGMQTGLDSPLTIFKYSDQIKDLSERLNKYQKGAKNRAAENNKKWAIANEYFIEEIPKHKTLTAARSEAARRTGIYATERHLAEMMPNPNKNK